jgi:hypothetical protein
MAGKLTPAAIAYDILQQLHIDCSGLCCALLLPSYLPLEGDSTIRYGIAQNTAGAKYTLEASWKPSGIGHISRRGEGRQIGSSVGVRACRVTKQGLRRLLRIRGCDGLNAGDLGNIFSFHPPYLRIGVGFMNRSSLHFESSACQGHDEMIIFIFIIDSYGS